MEWIKVSRRMLLGIITGLCSFQGLNPLAPAFFMAFNGGMGEKLMIWCCITGSIFIRLGVNEGARYGIVMGISFLISKMGQAIWKDSIHKRAIITALVMVGVTYVNVIRDVPIQVVTFQAITEGCIVLGLIVLLDIAFRYEQSRSRMMEQEEVLGWVLLLSGVLYGIELPYSQSIVIRQVAVWFMILYIAYRFGMAESAIFSVFLGFVLYQKGAALSFGTASVFYCCGFYILCGIGASLLRKFGRLISITSMMAVAYAMFYWAHDLRRENWNSILIASVCFLLLPKTMVCLAKQEKKKEAMDEVLLTQVKHQLKDFSEAFKRVKTTLLFATKEWEEKKGQEQVLEHTVQEVCKQCEYNGYCWDTEAGLSYEQVGAAMEQMEVTQSIGDVANQPFFTRCPKQEAFLAEIRHGFEMNKLETIYNERILEGREAMAGQFEQMARVVDDLFKGTYQTIPISDKNEIALERQLKSQKVKISHVSQVKNRTGQKEIYISACTKSGRVLTTRELGKTIEKVFGYPVRSKSGNRTIIGKKMARYAFLEESEFYYLQGVARISKMESDISGDNFSILEYQAGKLGVMIADGMGSGEYASKKSALLIELMERLLEAGFERDVALRLLNSVLVTPVSDTNFSTLDLCMIDLYKGNYEFYKVGGATSFIKRGNQVKTIQGGAIPVGIFPHLEYDLHTEEIREGDLLFLLSDGVMESVQELEKEAWIAEEIKRLMPVSPQEMATRLMSRIQKLGGETRRDDLTIVVIGIWRRV